MDKNHKSEKINLFLNGKMRNNIVLLIASICFGVIILELGLRWFTVFPLSSLSDTSNVIRIDKNSLRLSPKLKGIDSNGFRNPKALKVADIVTIGDSHTYGNNVTSEYSWPYQLGEMANKTVYNLGIGGFSVANYYYLIDEAIKLNPKQIIIGLLLENDMKYTCQLLIDFDDLRVWAQKNNINIEHCKKYDSTEVVKSDVNRTAIGSLVDLMVYQPLESKLIYFKEKFGRKENNVIIINDENQPTMSNHVRIDKISRNLDLKRQEVRTVFEITMKLFREMKEKADKNNIVFSVMIIPSKERAYYYYLLNKDYMLPSEFYQLVENEKIIVTEFSNFFSEAGIRYIDAQPYVVNALYGSDKVYKNSDDGHPIEGGYHAYAKSVYENLLQ